MNSSLVLLLVVLPKLALTTAQLMYTIEEEQTAGLTVGNIVEDFLTMENDSLPFSKEIRLSIHPGPFQSLFHIDETTGSLRTTEPIDREGVCPGQKGKCIIEVKVAVVQPVERFKVMSVHVVVLDLNDHAPTFDREKFTVSILESSRPGLSVYPVPVAKDPDSTKFSIQRYALLTSAADETTFQVRLTSSDDRPLSPQLVLVGSLDRETTPSYSLSLMAYDGGSPPLSAALSITVTVLDVNDNSPRFESVYYNVSILENAETMTLVTQVRAVDRDTGENGLIRYRLSDATKDLYGDLFLVDNTTGQIQLAKKLTPDYKPVYNLVVIGEDSGLEPRSSSVRVSVTVKDVNTDAPNITISSISKTGRLEVMENQSDGSFVGYVYVYDGDRGVNGEVGCAVLNPNFTLQAIYPNTYKLLTAVMFDREASPIEVVKIRCSDLGSPPLTSLRQAEVHIGDVNDNAPEFIRSVFEATVAENSPIDLSVITVLALDGDTGSNAELVYELQDSTPGGDSDTRGQVKVKVKVRVDSETGIVRVASNLDYEDTQMIRAVIIAKDRGLPSFSSTATIIIHVQNVNDCVPKFTQMSFSFGISENVASLSEVGTVSAIDSDLYPFNELVYRLLDSSSTIPHEQSPFQINSKTGKLMTTAPLDRERRSVHYLGVLAIDLQNPDFVSTATVTVYVADRNDNPPVIDFPRETDHPVQVSKFSPVGFIIARIAARDSDTGPNAALVYNISLDDGRHGNGVFEVDPSNGAIYLSESLQESDSKEFRLRVSVSDQGVPRLSASSTIIIKVNDSLTFAGTQSLLLPTGSGNNGLGFHRKLMAIFGSVTAFLVVILIVAIVFVRRRHPKDIYSTVNTTRSLCQPLSSAAPITTGDMVEDGTLKVKDIDCSAIISSSSSSLSSKKAIDSVLGSSLASDCDQMSHGRVFNIQHAIVGNHYLLPKNQLTKDVSPAVSMEVNQKQFIQQKNDDQLHRKNCGSGSAPISDVPNISRGSLTICRSIPTIAPHPVYGTMSTFLPRTTPNSPSNTTTMTLKRPMLDNCSNTPKLSNVDAAMRSAPNVLNISGLAGLTNFERGKTMFLVRGESYHHHQPCCNHPKSSNFGSETGVVSNKTPRPCHVAPVLQTSNYLVRSDRPMVEPFCVAKPPRTKPTTTNRPNGLVVVDGETDDGQSSTSGSFVIDTLRSIAAATDV